MPPYKCILPHQTLKPGYMPGSAHQSDKYVLRWTKQSNWSNGRVCAGLHSSKAQKMRLPIITPSLRPLHENYTTKAHIGEYLTVSSCY